MGWRELVSRVMKVPAQPSPPPGAAPRVFRAANNYFYLKALGWFAGQIFVLGAAIAGWYFERYLLTLDLPYFVDVLLKIGLVSIWITLIGGFILGFGIMRLDYELRWYLVSDRAIRIREGIRTVREKTIALANIQNISVKQGPLQRLFGIADVEVRTAGGGSSGSGGKDSPALELMHIGYFRGVDNASEIRDLLLTAVNRHKDSGLGDPDDHHHSDSGNVDRAARVAALAILGEARKMNDLLRAGLSSRESPQTS